MGHRFNLEYFINEQNMGYFYNTAILNHFQCKEIKIRSQKKLKNLKVKEILHSKHNLYQAALIQTL